MSAAQQNGWTYAQQATSLTCRHLGVQSLVGLEHLSELTELNLNNYPVGLYNVRTPTSPNIIEDLAPLVGLQKLTGLTLWQNRVKSITPLAQLTALKSIDLSRNYISDLSPLKACKALEGLRAEENEIESLGGLEALEQLKRLSLAHNAINELPSRLSTQLEHLDLTDNKLTEFTVQSQFPQLTSFSIDNNQLLSLAGLESMPALTVLSAKDNQIQSLDALQHVPNLASLDLGNNHIVNLEPVRPLVKLTDLDVRNNQIEQLAPLAALTSLNILTLDENPLGGSGPLHAALEPLRNLTELNDLSINRIADNNLPDTDDNRMSLAFLADLTALESLSVENPPVHFDLTPLTQLTQLYSLNLSFWEKGTINLQVLSELSALSALDILGSLVDEASFTALLSMKETLKTFETSLTTGSALFTVLPQLDKVTDLVIQYLIMRPGEVGIDLSVLAQMPQLQILDLFPAVFGFTSRYKANVGFLGSLTNLSGLSISWMGVDSLAPIASLSKLSSLRLNGVAEDAPIVGHAWMSSLTKLRRLELVSMGLTDLSFLSENHKTSLNYLDVAYNSITDLSPLAGFSQLNILDIWSNQVTELSALEHTLNLVSVDFSNNPLEDGSIERFKKKRWKVELKH